MNGWVDWSDYFNYSNGVDVSVVVLEITPGSHSKGGDGSKNGVLYVWVNTNNHIPTDYDWGRDPVLLLGQKKYPHQNRG